MTNIIYTSEKEIKEWTEKTCKAFFDEFSVPITAKETACRYINEAYKKTVTNYTKMPKLICDTIQCIIGAFWERNRFCITIMNPRNGDFGKAILAPNEELNISYGIALAFSRMKGYREYQLMKRASETELKNGQFIYDRNHVPFSFVGYYPIDKSYGVVLLSDGTPTTIKLKNFYVK